MSPFISASTLRSNRLAISVGLLLCVLCRAAPTADFASWDAALRAMFPGMHHLGEVTEDPRSTTVFGEDEILGYALFTADVLSIPAYSGRPINALVGFDTHGVLKGVRVVAHEEPILAVGISEEQLADYVAQYVGLPITDDIRIGGDPAPGRQVIDGLSGATITTMVVNRSLVEGARKVALARGLLSIDGTQRTFEPPLPLWMTSWQERIGRIAVLVVGLVLLLCILLFQDWLARHPTFLLRVRTLYLLFTLFFVGAYGYAQLSIVNVFTFIGSLLGGFRWESFLLDPMMFLLWGFVTVTILLWGRGVYCGWLCPFGALQELLYRAGQRLGIRGRELPTVVHERLLALKYVVLIGLFGLFLQSLVLAERYAEVEPFKTVFALHFAREWPFVVYALVLLVLGLFIRKAFCRYLCPLGAALTFPSRFRIFDWLRRRKECGRPCQTCARECEVQAIRPTGEIVDTECHYCLDCQVTYWNDQRCPPLVERRKKAEVKARLSQPRQL
ncbi:MAG: 4Fe-4S binding protein [Gammaproteobacteria bacterium]|nr:4Fe-4S binding protein [Gammaproteobacteria bacterium]MCP5298581.1 4Fe-4S binding protein [Chromatiaceae bacterium]